MATSIESMRKFHEQGVRIPPSHPSYFLVAQPHDGLGFFVYLQRPFCRISQCLTSPYVIVFDRCTMVARRVVLTTFLPLEDPRSGAPRRVDLVGKILKLLRLVPGYPLECGVPVWRQYQT